VPPSADEPRRTAAKAPAGKEPTGKPIGRRVVLGLLGLGALGVATGSAIQNGLDNILKPLQDTGVGNLIPGGGGWTIYTVTGGFPAAPADYKLQVGGMVEHKMALSVDELRELPATRLTKDFQCVTGWRVDDVHWEGVALTDLAERAGMSAKAGAFRFTSFDGVYTESLTLDQARQSGAIIAYSMLGAPVTRQHGGPVRLYVPGMYGYKSCKWLSGVYAVPHLEYGYWEENGYPVNAWIGGSAPSSPAAAQ
jgi:DMSO/TMAO reductase YedYZ molybdopterin-dependent catalytic subunit